MGRSKWLSVLASLVLGCALLACGDDDGGEDGGSSGSGGGGSGGEDSGSTSDSGATTLCAKYGGADEVAGLVPPILGAISGDCRVNSFFAVLSEEKINHIAECMVIQVSELFGCPGFTYEGSEDSNGEPCVDMVTAHATLNISDGDFNALVDDMASGLMEGGVSGADIQSVAPVIAGMKPDIVQDDSTDVTQAACDGGVDGG
jgi:hypothetical protein